MLALLNGGRCCSNDEMLDLFEIHIPDMLDQDACDDAFCEDYTCAMNRMRVLAARDTPTPVRVHSSGNRRQHAYYTCGRCGANLRPDLQDDYCGKCGTRTRWP